MKRVSDKYFKTLSLSVLKDKGSDSQYLNAVWRTILEEPVVLWGKPVEIKDHVLTVEVEDRSYLSAFRGDNESTILSRLKDYKLEVKRLKLTIRKGS